MRSLKPTTKRDAEFMSNVFFDIQDGITEETSAKMLKLTRKYVLQLHDKDILYGLFLLNEKKEVYSDRMYAVRTKTMSDIHWMVMRNYYNFSLKNELEAKDILAIHAEVCKEMGVNFDQTLTRSRYAKLAIPRHITAFLCLKRSSYEKIAKTLGRKNHTTVISSVRRVANLMTYDPLFNKKVIDIKAKLGL